MPYVAWAANPRLPGAEYATHSHVPPVAEDAAVVYAVVLVCSHPSLTLPFSALPSRHVPVMHGRRDSGDFVGFMSHLGVRDGRLRCPRVHFPRQSANEPIRLLQRLAITKAGSTCATFFRTSNTVGVVAPATFARVLWQAQKWN
jgi:hypothetical protein